MTIRLATVLTGTVLALSGCAAPTPEVAAPPPHPGRAIVNQMIEAHGGLEKWRAAPTVSFTDAFQPAGAPAPAVSRVTVEQSRRRAYLDFPDHGARITWDGEKAWSENWKSSHPPRFVALLSYYFANLPWLTLDPGVNLSPPGRDRLGDDPTEYLTVKMTFDPGVGDTPDDYYLLYIHPETYRLRGARFTVTYADLLPPGVEEIEESIVYEEFTPVEGLLVPTRATVYDKDGGPVGAFEWREWSFSKPFDEGRMEMPAGAVVDTTNPTRAVEDSQP